MEGLIVGEGGLVPSPSPLLPSVYMPRAEAPAVAAPAPLPAGTPDSLPTPPDLLAHVTRAAESSLPSEARQPLLLLRVSMLLQDAVEAACMCARAHIDAPLLAKHLLGAEQHQQFVAAQEESASPEVEAERTERVNEFAKAVASTVGEVRCRPMRRCLRSRQRGARPARAFYD